MPAFSLSKTWNVAKLTSQISSSYSCLLTGPELAPFMPPIAADGLVRCYARLALSASVKKDRKVPPTRFLRPFAQIEHSRSSADAAFTFAGVPGGFKCCLVRL